MTNEQQITKNLDLFYSFISGKAGEERNWDELKKLFAISANFTPYELPDDDEKKSISYNIDTYIERLQKYFMDHDFNERGFNYKIDIWGNIASVSSQYKAEIIKDNSTYMKMGINLIQLIYDGNDWKIISMLWENMGNHI